MTQYLTHPVSLITIACAVIIACAFLLDFLYALRPLRRVARHTSDDSATDGVEPRKVSVIVYIENRDAPLDEFIETLLQQDYPDFEIIGVNDANAEATAPLVERFEGNDRVYITFVPQGSHNLSRRKLALTLGMKAAKGDVVVTTSTNAVIPSGSWLSEMMRPFNTNPDTELVLGVTAMDFQEMRGIKKWYRQFDNVMTTCQWVGYALAGKPYRGDGHNLAFLRRVFFEHKGYAKTINLHNGDDDLFVHEIARPGNSAVVLSPQTLLTTEWGDSSRRIYVDKKERYDFDAKWLPTAPFFRAGVLSVLQWVVLAACVCGAWFSFPNLAVAGGAFVLLLLFWWMEIALYRKVAAQLGAIRLWWALPLFMLWHPIGNFIFRLRHRSRRFKNFTWVRRK